jgi:hypothetical protein
MRVRVRLEPCALDQAVALYRPELWMIQELLRGIVIASKLEAVQFHSAGIQLHRPLAWGLWLIVSMPHAQNCALDCGFGTMNRQTTFFEKR